MTARFPSFVEELPLTREALEFAAQRHERRTRAADRAPFILHPLEVAHLLHGRGYPDHVVAAGVLHEVIEEGAAEPAELERRFGAAVASLVCVVTEPDQGSWPERKQGLREAVGASSEEAAIVFAADKVAKVREARVLLATGRAGDASAPSNAERIAHYWASLEVLEERLGRHPLVRQLRFELEALELLPPGAAQT
jgi:(p)ppGpp synthase/HD superfamily hydrolase